jgi:hypothetical protein
MAVRMTAVSLISEIEMMSQIEMTCVLVFFSFENMSKTHTVFNIVFLHLF